MNRFGVMLDMSRNAVMKPDEVINFAKTIKPLGYNMIQLYTEDTYQVENEPYFGYLRGRYTFEEQKKIVDECEKIGIEVIPCIQTLAHLNQIFRWQPYFEVNDINDILLMEEDRTYALIENMFKTLRKSFKSQYIHIGMDEAHMFGLGKYLDKHGVKNRFEILKNHLDKVIALAEKYNFKPIMWSDMFFKLDNNGEYYSENPIISKETIELTPKNVGLVYWDYYHDDKKVYDKMIEGHQKFNNEVWFAGGAWTWTGFAPGNKKSLETMYPAMISAKEHNINNIFITMWGDNGKECSYYSVLPSLFAIRKFYDGVTDMDIIKKEFKKITGENFDEMFALDIPNYVGGNKTCTGNVCKFMLYNDPFYGAYNSAIRKGAEKQFEEHAKTLEQYGNNSKKYGYIFHALSALCDVLSVKYSLSYNLRKAYEEKDNEKLKEISSMFSLTLEKLEVFYEKFSYLWHKENKPNGFDVQDLRIGGLKQRLVSCKKRIDDYLDGKGDLDDLNEKVLDWNGTGENWETEDIPCLNSWIVSASVNVI